MEMLPVAEQDSPPPSPKVTFDDILATVGNFGIYQKLVVFLVILPMVLPSGFLSMSSVRQIVQCVSRDGVNVGQFITSRWVSRLVVDLP